MNTQIMNVPIDHIRYNRYNLAGTINREKVEEIKTSLLQNRDNGSKGLLQIPRGRKGEAETYEQAFGRHRLIAFQELAAADDFWNEMPLLVSELSDIEMFELMGIENFHRRDISPVEEAGIFEQYMTKFGKTSIDAAQKFGKTDEYVRQATRLLNLPEAAQRMMGEGTLNKSGARDLLVLQRVGGAELVNEALDVILARPEDNASETISDVMRQCDNTKWMDANADWFSANKNFPYKHLKPLVKGDVEEHLRYADGTSEGKPIALIKEVLTLVSAGMDVTDEAFPALDPSGLERVRVLAHPTPCEKCPLHAVLNGNHYCGLPLCMERKKAAWEEKIWDDKVKKLGIPLHQKSDGGYLKLSKYEAADKKLWDEKGPDLRLRKVSYEWNNFEGLDSETAVVIVGDTFEKRMKKIRAKESSSQDDQADREKEATVRELKVEFVRRFTWEVTSLAFEPALAGIPSLGLLMFFANEINDQPDFPEAVQAEELLDTKKLKKADALKHLRRYVMHSALDLKFYRGGFNLSADEKKPVLKHAKNIEKIAEEWDVKLPKDFMKQAEQYQAELDAAIKAVEAADE